MGETFFVRQKKERDYTVVDNTYIRDCEISWKAKGLFTYILSLPEDWKIYMTELVNHSTGGREELKSIVKELISAGYICRSKTQDEKGLFVGWSYNIIESPEGRIIRERENRPSDIPTSENPQLLSTNSLPSTNKQSTETNSKPKQTRKKQEFVIPTIDEITEYILEKQLVINPYKFKEWYDRTDWKDTEGKQVHNWKNKLLNWDSREKDKNKSAVPYSKPSSSSGVCSAPKCPVCGSPLKNGQYCKKCDKFFDEKGNELYA